MALVDLPPEILCNILERLSTKDLFAARLAHRCLAVVRESQHALASRKQEFWLRTSPNRLCAAGHVDALAYLYRRRRVPRTLNLTAEAIDSGSIDMIRLVRRNCPLWNDKVALERTLANRDNLDLFYQLVAEMPRVDADLFAFAAIRQQRADVIDWIKTTHSPGWVDPSSLHEWTRLPYKHGPLTFDKTFAEALRAEDLALVRSLCEKRLPSPHKRQAQFDDALQRQKLDIARFLYDLGGCCETEDTLYAARRSPKVARFLATLSGFDIEEVMYEPDASIGVVQALCEVYPKRSRQRLLNGARSVAVARCACDNDRKIDLTEGLYHAAEAGQKDVVAFLCARGANIKDALGRAKARRHTQAIHMLDKASKEQASRPRS
jgi:hypothetical protein